MCVCAAADVAFGDGVWVNVTAVIAELLTRFDLSDVSECLEVPASEPQFPGCKI